MYSLFKSLVNLAYWYEFRTTNRFGNDLVMFAERITPERYNARMISERITSMTV
jgi:hypothetical protein